MHFGILPLRKELLTNITSLSISLENWDEEMHSPALARELFHGVYPKALVYAPVLASLGIVSFSLPGSGQAVSSQSWKDICRFSLVLVTSKLRRGMKSAF